MNGHLKRSSARARIVAAAAATSLAATTLLVEACGDDDNVLDRDASVPETSGDTAASDSGVSEGSSRVDANDGGGRCPTSRGPQMVVVNADGGSFCIDTTEVTQAQYAAFLASPDRNSFDAGRGSVCGYAASVEVEPGPMPILPAAAGFDGGCSTESFTPDATPNRPVTCIDHCGAAAFCAWAGKRLCRVDPPLEWEEACSPDRNARPYPYGAAFIPGACNGPGATETVNVGSLATCEGGVPGLYDMSGNVNEWTLGFCDNTGTAIPRCPIRGGSYAAEDAGLLACGAVIDYPNSPTAGANVWTRSVDLGFRCCAD